MQTQRKDLFFPLQSYSKKTLRKNVTKSARKYKRNLLMPPWASYNTPYIELIQYGRSICKKVYLHANFMLCECKWILFKNQLRKKTY